MYTKNTDGGRHREVNARSALVRERSLERLVGLVVAIFRDEIVRGVQHGGQRDRRAERHTLIGGGDLCHTT